MSHDYSQYENDNEAPPDKLESLRNWATMHEEALEEAAVLALQLEAVQKRIKDIEFFKIPELMEELEIEDFTLTNGQKIEVKEELYAALLKDKKAEGIAWLLDQGHEKIVKRTISMSFAKGEYEDAEKFMEELAKIDENREYEDKTDVHFQTLKAFIKEKLEQGAEFPEEFFSIHRQRVAKFKAPKK